MTHIALVRVPFTYRYNRTDVREDVIVTALAAYLEAVDAAYRIYDFHLDRQLEARDILRAEPSAVVIAVRETGDNVHYALRLAGYLARRWAGKIVLYGHTARLAGHPLVPERVLVVAHDEGMLAEALGLSAEGPQFAGELGIAPYAYGLPLEPWQKKRFRGTIETSRGCPFPCKFCFINAGANHARRWQLQRPQTTLAAIERYVEQGTRALVFHDSEFFGGSQRDLASRERLLAGLSGGPPIAFKIYSRADSISRFAQLEALRDAGLVSVFIGVESFVQSDLDSLGKRIDARLVLETIRRLAGLGIYMDLSFILFHHATTPATLRTNLELLLELYGGASARYLGMPHFTFSFESAWRDAPTRTLSDATYVGWDVGIKSPLARGVVFDPQLEPLMELYRLMAYEWSRKVVDLSLARDAAGDGDRSAIEAWFAGLGAFCAHTMLELLGEFECGRITLASLPDERERLFARLSRYHARLPEALRPLATYDAHARRIDYRGSSERVEEDEYWLAQIPEAAGAMTAVEL